MTSAFREENGDDEVAVLLSHTQVIVTGSNRTKSVLVGLQGVVKKAVSLGGWHWLIHTTHRMSASILQKFTSNGDRSEEPKTYLMGASPFTAPDAFIESVASFGSVAGYRSPSRPILTGVIPELSSLRQSGNVEGLVDDKVKIAGNHQENSLPLEYESMSEEDVNDGWWLEAINRGAKKCYNQSLCDELLSPILPAKPPFHPRQFERCAVVGNSGDLLLTEFGEEIDSHDAVIRDNEAPVNEKYAKYVGLKRTFRLGVRGVARNMIKILKGAPEEVFIIKSVIHRDFDEMIKSIANPVYLFQGIVLRRGAKGTGMKSIELALSMCDIVDIYGFTVDPGYKEWTRYFSEPKKGHNPLQGRAYYQLLECLEVIRIHSPMRAQRNEDWSDIPSRDAISRAHGAAIRLKQHETTGQFNDVGQFRNCKFWGEKGAEYNGQVSGSPDMSDVRKTSNYSKWELMPFESLREEAQEYYKQMEGVSMYKVDGNKLDDLVCVRHSTRSAD